MNSFESFAGSLACGVRERFEGATKVVDALVGELACRLDLVGDAADLSLEAAAARCQVDHHAALIGRVTASGNQAGRIEPLEQRGDRTRVHVEASPEGADRERRAIQEFQDYQVLGKGQAQWLEGRPLDLHPSGCP